MSTQSFTLEKATSADIPALGKIFSAAFADDRNTELKYLHEAPEAPYEMMCGALEWWISKPTKCPVMKAVKSGEILGWMCWGYSGYEELVKQVEDKDKEDSTASSDLEKTAANGTPDKIARLKAIQDKESERWTEILSNKCMYIVGIAVSPSHQGLGVGTALIQWGTKKADRDGVTCWVHSSDGGWRAFEKNGFKEDRRLELDLDEYADQPRKGEDGKWGKYIFRYMQRKPQQMEGLVNITVE